MEGVMSASYDSETEGVICITSDDEEQVNFPTLNSVAVAEDQNSGNPDAKDDPQVEGVFHIEYFIPSQVVTTYDSYKISSKESVTTRLENQTNSIEEVPIIRECLNLIDGNIVPQTNPAEQKGLSFQVLATNPDDSHVLLNGKSKPCKPTELALKRLADDLLKVVSASVTNENSNTAKLSNIEKTILEVSKLDFDISNVVLPPRTKSQPLINSPIENGNLDRKDYLSESLNVIRLSEQSKKNIKKRGRPLEWRKKENIISKVIIKEQSNITNMKKKRGRPVGWKKRSSMSFQNTAISTQHSSKSGSYVNDNMEASCDLKDVSKRYKDVTFTLVPLTHQATELGTESTQEDSESHHHEELNLIKETRDINNGHALLPCSESVMNIISSSKLIDKSSLPLTLTTEAPVEVLKLNNNDSDFKINFPEDLDKIGFVTYYNQIFDDQMIDLCKKMGELIVLAIKEEESYLQRLVMAEKLTCEQLREKEKEISKTTFNAAYDKYKISFTLLFQEMLSVILTNVSTTKLRKIFLLAWFIKIFLKITDLFPELSDSLTSVWKKTNDMLSNYKNPLPVVREIFSLSEVNFEKVCLETLDLIQECFSRQFIPKITSSPQLGDTLGDSCNTGDQEVSASVNEQQKTSICLVDCGTRVKTSNSQPASQENENVSMIPAKSILQDSLSGTKTLTTSLREYSKQK